MTGCASEILEFVLYECIFINRYFLMALNTCEFGMGSGEREFGLLMVEVCRRPVVESVAVLAFRELAAFCLHCELSEVYIPVAGLAVRIQRTKNRNLDASGIFPVMTAPA